MGLNCGIVGLPNVGKSTLFSALTSAPAEAANYPFCTIDPNIGVVNVPDARLYKIAELVKPQKVIPAIVEFVDIAGLVKGASSGEGLGNKFLSHIRQVNVILHVVRAFEDEDITHVSNTIDPLSDIETINIELALADLDSVEKRIDKSTKESRSANKDVQKAAVKFLPLLERLKETLSSGKAARSLEYSDDEWEYVKNLQLITTKKVVYVCNVDEEGLESDNAHVQKVKEFAAAEDADTIKICAKLESEISSLESDDERAEFLEAAGLEESGLNQLIHHAYSLLGYETYFTAGEKEVRAWTFPHGSLAPQAAGIIHTDFEKGFIKAEVYHYDDLMKYSTEAQVKSAGKLRIEGKEYQVKDGDIMHFRFNV
jgi:GTP-binding protein YchF